MKVGLEVFGPVGIGAWRVSTGAAALAVLWGLQRRPWPLRWADVPALGFITILGYAVPFVLQPYIIAVIEAHSGHGSSFSGMMVSLVPLMTIVVSVPILGIYPTGRQLLGVIGGLAAMLYLFGGELAGGVLPRDLLLASITPVCYAVANTYLKRRFSRMSASALVLCTLSLSSLILVPAAAIVEPAGTFSHPALGRAVLSLVVLGIVCTGVATFLFYTLVQERGPLFAAMVTYIIPCVSLLQGWLWGETITGRQLISLGGIFVMVTLVQWRGRRAPAEVAVGEQPGA